MLAQSKFLFPNSVSFPSFALALHFFVSGSEVCPWVIIADTPKPTLHTGPFNSFHFSSLQASLCAAIMNDQGSAARHRELSLSHSLSLSLSHSLSLSLSLSLYLFSEADPRLVDHYLSLCLSSSHLLDLPTQTIYIKDFPLAFIRAQVAKPIS